MECDYLVFSSVVLSLALLVIVPYLHGYGLVVLLTVIIFLFIVIYFSPYALNEPDPKPIPVELWDFGDDPR